MLVSRWRVEPQAQQTLSSPVAPPLGALSPLQSLLPLPQVARSGLSEATQHSTSVTLLNSTCWWGEGVSRAVTVFSMETSDRQESQPSVLTVLLPGAEPLAAPRWDTAQAGPAG